MPNSRDDRWTTIQDAATQNVVRDILGRLDALDTNVKGLVIPDGFIQTKMLAANVVTAAKIAVGAIAAALGYTPENAANKGANNGYAGLDGTGKVPASQLPSLVISHTYTVNSQAAMLALAANQGDVCIRNDLTETYILAGTDPTQLSNWTELLFPTGGVTSFNSRTGAVALSSADVTSALTFTPENTAKKGASGGYPALNSFSSLSVPNNSACRVYQSAGQAFAASTLAKVQFNTKEFDNQNEFDSVTNYRFTAKDAGIYSLEGVITLNSPSSGCAEIIELYKNGSIYRVLSETLVSTSGGMNVDLNFNAQVKLNANDYIEIYFQYAAAVTTISGAARTSLSITKSS